LPISLGSTNKKVRAIYPSEASRQDPVRGIPVTDQASETALRCALLRAYHDEEWGVPEYDSRALWEKLMLDGFQAGLSWLTILRKNFDPEKVARFAETDIVKLLANAGIVRLGAGNDSNSPRFWHRDI
jgi:Methyladenine glycosylase